MDSNQLLNGRFPAVIESEPDFKLRYKVRMLPEMEKWKIKDLPLATSLYFVPTRFNQGASFHLKKGDQVWIDFPYKDVTGNKDPRRPEIIGFRHTWPDDLPNNSHNVGDYPLSLSGMFDEPEGNWVKTPDSQACDTDSVTLGSFNLRIRSGFITATHLPTGGRLAFDSEGSLDFSAARNLHLRAKGKLITEAKDSDEKRAKVNQLIQELRQELGKWDVDAAGVNFKSKGLFKLIAGTIQLQSLADLLISSGGKLDLIAQGAGLIKVGADTSINPKHTTGLRVLQKGAGLAQMVISPAGLFNIENSAADLGQDILLKWINAEIDKTAAEIDKNAKEIEFLNEYLAHNHTTAVGSSSQPKVMVKGQAYLNQLVEYKISLNYHKTTLTAVKGFILGLFNPVKGAIN